MRTCYWISPLETEAEVEINKIFELESEPSGA
jgi:hypothetical protein